MVIALRFDPDASLAETHMSEGLLLDNPSLESVFFELPVHVVIDDTDLTAGRRLPILSVGPVGLVKLKQTVESGAAMILLDGGDIYFELKGDIVTVHSGQTDKTARVPYDELLDAWAKFAEEVRQYLVNKFPELRSDRFWGEWLSGGKLPYYGPPLIETVHWKGGSNRADESAE